MDDVTRATGTMNAFGGHWVYAESINLQGPDPRIRISTWGKTHQPLTVPISKLVSWYWGFISGNPAPR
jgi:hypothetical protein